MADPETDAYDTMIETMLAQMGITPEQAWLAAIRGNLKTIMSVAKLVDEFPLPDEIEPAPVYEA